MNILTNLNLNGNELRNATIQNLTMAPQNPVIGQMYFNTQSHEFQVYDGERWLIGGVSDLPEMIIGNITGLQEALNTKLPISVFNTHNTDAVKHITADERASWNDKWDYDAATIKGVKVDNAFNSDKTNGFTLGMNVPEGSKLTDTILVSSVNGKTGAVKLTSSDIGMSTTDPTSIGDKIDAIVVGVDNLSNEKVDKVVGKGLSTKDFTNDLETKLNGIATGATKVEKSATNGNIKINGTENVVYTHPGTGTNPHGTTKADVGLSTVENKSSAVIRSEITNNNVTNALGYVPLDTTLRGAKNGLAELDASGLVPASQLPGYVDDVMEFASRSVFPRPGENDKIYIAMDTNIIYRWGGTEYTEISSTLALGETQQTAYRGDRGKVAYDHSQTSHAPANAQKNSDITKAEIEAKLTGTISSHKHIVTKNDVDLGNVENTADIDKCISTATQAALDNKISVSERVNFMTRFTSPVGDGTAKSYTLNHNLGTKFVVVSLYDTATGEEVWTDITRTTNNAIKLEFAQTVATNKYTVVVIG